MVLKLCHFKFTMYGFCLKIVNLPFQIDVIQISRFQFKSGSEQISQYHPHRDIYI